MKISFAVEQGQNDERMVGDHVAAAGIDAVAVGLLDALERFLPIVIGGMPAADVGDHSG